MPMRTPQHANRLGIASVATVMVMLAPARAVSGEAGNDQVVGPTWPHRPAPEWPMDGVVIGTDATGSGCGLRMAPDGAMALINGHEALHAVAPGGAHEVRIADPDARYRAFSSGVWLRDGRLLLPIPAEGSGAGEQVEAVTPAGVSALLPPSTTNYGIQATADGQTAVIWSTDGRRMSAAWVVHPGQPPRPLTLPALHGHGLVSGGFGVDGALVLGAIPDDQLDRPSMLWEVEDWTSVDDGLHWRSIGAHDRRPVGPLRVGEDGVFQPGLDPVWARDGGGSLTADSALPADPLLGMKDPPQERPPLPARPCHALVERDAHGAVVRSIPWTAEAGSPWLMSWTGATALIGCYRQLRFAAGVPWSVWMPSWDAWRLLGSDGTLHAIALPALGDRDRVLVVTDQGAIVLKELPSFASQLWCAMVNASPRNIDADGDLAAGWAGEACPNPVDAGMAALLCRPHVAMADEGQRRLLVWDHALTPTVAASAQRIADAPASPAWSADGRMLGWIAGGRLQTWSRPKQ